MTQPIQLPDPGSDTPRSQRAPVLTLPAVAVTLALVAGTALLGVAGGYLWAAMSPRATLVMTAPGQASLIQVETTAYIAADGAFAAVALVGGAIAGAVGHVLAVRRHGPLAMAGLLGGAVAAAYLARWVGEQSSRATFQHLLATLPAGARLHDALSLGASGALAFWPLAAGLVAGGLELLSQRASIRSGAHRVGPGRVVA